MINKTKFVIACVSAFVIGFSVNNFAMSDVNSKIAVVDVSMLVNSSPQVAALKKEQEAKTKEIVAFVDKARKEVAAVQDANKKQALENKYNKELQAKKEAMDKNYALKLRSIEKTISSQITNKAKTGNYDLVLAKSVVLYGGVDITEVVKNAIK